MPVYTVTYELVDAYQRSTRKVFETATLADFDAALSAAGALAADLAAISEADVLAYTVGLRSTYVDDVTAGANKDEGATFVLRKEDNHKGVLKVPAPINAIFNADGTVIITNAQVTDFVANFLTGGDFVFSDGEQATSLLSGRLDK